MYMYSMYSMYILHATPLFILFWHEQKEKKCYVALTRPWYKNWVGMSRDFFLFFHFFILTYDSFPKEKAYFFCFKNDETSEMSGMPFHWPDYEVMQVLF